MPRSIELGGDLVVKNMKKLTKLTAEQQAMIIPHKEMWLNKFYQNKGIDKELATEQIKWLYNFCGQKEPVVMFMDSPFGSQILLSGVKKDNIGQKSTHTFMRINTKSVIFIFSIMHFSIRKCWRFF